MHRAIRVPDHVGLLALPARGDSGRRGRPRCGTGPSCDACRQPSSGGDSAGPRWGRSGVRQSALMKQGLTQAERRPTWLAPPCRPFCPDESSDGTSPLKDRTPAEGAEPARVTEATEDLSGVRRHRRLGRIARSRRDRGSIHHGDALLEFVDLGGRAQGQPGLDGDVVGQLAEIELVAPDGQRLVGRRQAGARLPHRRNGRGNGGGGTRPRRARPIRRHRCGIGVASSAKAQEAPLGQPAADGSRATPGLRISRSASIRQITLDRRLTRLERSLVARRSGTAGPRCSCGIEPLWVQQGDPGQDLRVQAVRLGVLGVVIPQVSGLLGGHHDDRGPLRRNHEARGTQAFRVGSMTTVTSESSGSDLHSASSSSERRPKTSARSKGRPLCRQPGWPGGPPGRRHRFPVSFFALHSSLSCRDRRTAAIGEVVPDIHQQGSDRGPVTEYLTGRSFPGVAPARLTPNRQGVVRRSDRSAAMQSGHRSPRSFPPPAGRTVDPRATIILNVREHARQATPQTHVHLLATLVRRACHLRGVERRGKGGQEGGSVGGGAPVEKSSNGRRPKVTPLLVTNSWSTPSRPSWDGHEYRAARLHIPVSVVTLVPICQ